MEQWLIDGRTIYELHQDGWNKGEPVMVNRWSAHVQGNGKAGATPAELEAIAQRMVKVPELESALAAATERAAGLERAIREAHALIPDCEGGAMGAVCRILRGALGNAGEGAQ